MAPEQTFTNLQGLEQEHTLAPRQLQSLDFLAMPQVELEARIRSEQESNPVLELEDPPSRAERSDDESDEPNRTDERRSAQDDYLPESGVENIDGNRDDFTESMESYLESGSDFFQGTGRNEEEDQRRQDFFDSFSVDASLQEQLLEQLRLSDCPGELRRIAEEVIGNIGENGYFESAAAEIAQSCSCSVDDAEKALALVQTFDPAGIGARDLRECLLLQIGRDPQKYDFRLTVLVRDHLDEILRNKRPQVAKAMGVSLDELNFLIGEIRKLDPAPGSSAVSVHAEYIAPEVSVIRGEDGEFHVQYNRDVIPKLRVSADYEKMANDPATPADAKKYLSEKIAAVNQLKDSLEQRVSTIQRIADLIVANQHDFFEQGKKALRPMTMREIADKIDRNESTVSRAVADKYMQTPFGLVPMRDFFSGGFRNETGEEVSSRGIKEIIQNAVAKEDPASPLSDSKIEAILKERGFTVARRTIAKYREELGIQSSQLRKVYQ